MAKPLQQHRYQDYTVEFVYGKHSASMRQEVLELWRANGAILDSQEAERRSHELATIARNPAGEMVGLATAFVEKHDPYGCFHGYRMFIRPADRIFNLGGFMLLSTRDWLQMVDESEKSSALMFVSENEKLMKLRVRRFFETHGFKLIGQTPAGKAIWRCGYAVKSSEGKG